jgi:hypothetical protein
MENDRKLGTLAQMASLHSVPKWNRKLSSTTGWFVAILRFMRRDEKAWNLRATKSFL